MKKRSENEFKKSVAPIEEENRGAVKETVYLNGIPGLVESIHEAEREPLDKGTPIEEIDWR